MALCSGADAGRAEEAARLLIAQGCTALVSFGTAGGLDAGLAPGTVVIGELVVGPAGATFGTDLRWRAALAEALVAGGLTAMKGRIAGSDMALADAAAKDMLRRATGALCVDMESHAVAAVAIAAGLPFLAVRAVADPAGAALPRAALQSVGPDGALRPRVLLGALLARPGDMKDLIAMARTSHRALASLRRVAALGGPLLALP